MFSEKGIVLSAVHVSLILSLFCLLLDMPLFITPVAGRMVCKQWGINLHEHGMQCTFWMIFLFLKAYQCSWVVQQHDDQVCPQKDGLWVSESEHCCKMFWFLQLRIMYGLLTKCEVKMAGYWPSSFFGVFMDWDEANIQPSWPNKHG